MLVYQRVFDVVGMLFHHVSPFLARIQNMRDVVTILKMIVRLGVRMLQRQARNGPTRCAVGWFQQSDSKWFNNIWIFNDSWVVPLKGFRFRGNYCSHLSSLTQTSDTSEARCGDHDGTVCQMGNWKITWNDPKGLWRKSLAVPAKRLRWKSVNTECSQCQRTKWSQQIAKRAAQSKQLVLSEPEQNEHSCVYPGSNRFNSDSAMTQAILSKTPTLASLHSNSSKQFEFNSEQSSSSRSRACTKSSEKRANEWDYLWSCNSKLTMLTSRQKENPEI